MHQLCVCEWSGCMYAVITSHNTPSLRVCIHVYAVYVYTCVCAVPMYLQHTCTHVYCLIQVSLRFPVTTQTLSLCV